MGSFFNEAENGVKPRMRGIGTCYKSSCDTNWKIWTSLNRVSNLNSRTKEIIYSLKVKPDIRLSEMYAKIVLIALAFPLIDRELVTIRYPDEVAYNKYSVSQ